MNKRILVVAAHPDDETLGCGGALAKFADAGARCMILLLGGGLAARGVTDRGELSRIRRDAASAGAVLGAERVEVLDFPDNAMDAAPLLHIVQAVEAAIATFEPDTVITHHAGDLNIDHGLACRAVVTATRPFAGVCVREVWAFEVLSASEWGFGATGERFTPQIFVDVSGTLERKLQALRCYPSEMGAFPHPRSEEAVAALARRRGAQSGFQAAEAFQLIRALRG